MFMGFDIYGACKTVKGDSDKEKIIFDEIKQM